MMIAYKLVSVVITGLTTLEEEVRHFYLTATSKNRSYIVQKEIPVKKEGLAYVQAGSVSMDLIYGDTYIFQVQTVTMQGQKSPLFSFEKKIDYSVPAPAELNFSSSMAGRLNVSVDEDPDTAYYEWIVKKKDYPGSYQVFTGTSNTVVVQALDVSVNELAGRKVYIKSDLVPYTVVSNSIPDESGYVTITVSKNWDVVPDYGSELVIAIEVDFTKDIPTYKSSSSDPLSVVSNIDEELFFWVRRVSSYGGVSEWFPRTTIGQEGINCSQGVVKPTPSDFLNPRGTYNSATSYYYIPGVQRDIVKYSNLYYYKRTIGGVSGSAPSGTKTDNADWGYMEFFPGIATQILLAEDSSVLSSLVVGDATHAGIIKSYGWNDNGSVNGYKIVGGATPSITIVGGTITGGVIRTAATGKRIVINGADNSLSFYKDNTDRTILIDDDIEIFDTYTGTSLSVPGLMIDNGSVVFYTKELQAAIPIAIQYPLEYTDTLLAFKGLSIAGGSDRSILKRKGSLTGVYVNIMNSPDVAATDYHYGVYSLLATKVNSPGKAIAIYGSVSNGSGTGEAYAGLFDGDVKVNGTLNATTIQQNGVALHDRFRGIFSSIQEAINDLDAIEGDYCYVANDGMYILWQVDWFRIG